MSESGADLLWPRGLVCNQYNLRQKHRPKRRSGKAATTALGDECISYISFLGGGIYWETFV